MAFTYDTTALNLTNFVCALGISVERLSDDCETMYIKIYRRNRSDHRCEMVAKDFKDFFYLELIRAGISSLPKVKYKVVD